MVTSRFAELLHQYRLRAGWTQEELAERSRLSVRAISDLERGLKQTPRPSTVRLLAQALSLDDAATSTLLTAAGRMSTTAQKSLVLSRGGRTLPRELRSFIGREQELAELQSVLGGTALLTLVGSGGVGKTRLALRLAAESEPSYRDGVRLVELAPLADAALVPLAVATAVGLPERSGRPVVDALCLWLTDRCYSSTIVSTSSWHAPRSPTRSCSAVPN